jgi:hypothetical protein
LKEVNPFPLHGLEEVAADFSTARENSKSQQTKRRWHAKGLSGNLDGNKARAKFEPVIMRFISD